MGQRLALKAWYCDSTHRYTMTDAVQPLPVASARSASRPATRRPTCAATYMLAHGSHLVDTARFLCGEITEVRARLLERFGAYCWFVETGFANGTLGHLDLTVAVRMDWHEGFQLYGEHGSVVAKTYNPWYYRSSDVEIFHERDATTRRRARAPTGISFAASSKVSPTPCWTGAPHARRRRRGRACLGPRHGGDRANRCAPARRWRWPT